MESDFINLIAKVWANLEQELFMSFIFFFSFLVCNPLRWHSATVCDVTTVQLSNGTVHKFHNILLKFMKIYSIFIIFPLVLY